MREEIIKLIENHQIGFDDYGKTADKILRLFAVAGNALHDKIVKQIPVEYKEQISKTIKKHYR
jgi:hypothetical protein